MKVSLRESGGWQSGLVRPPVVIDSGGLSADQARVLQALVTAAEAVLPRPVPKRSVPEAESYAITVESPTGSFDLVAGDPDPSPAVQALVDWIRRHAG